MKKKLEAELISIAHRVLKMKNKSELIQLHLEAQKLYEKLSVLRFVEENFSDVKPTIGLSEIEEKLENSFEEIIQETKEIESSSEIEAKIETESTPETEPIAEIEAITEKESTPETIIEVVQEFNEPIVGVPISELVEDSIAPEALTSDEKMEELQEIVAEETQEEVQMKEEKTPIEEITFKPSFELSFEKEEEKVEIKPINTQITFEDLLGSQYVDPVFVKPEELENERQVLEATKSKGALKFETESITLNDKISKGFTVGLNDRIAFIKHLFANNTEDYNRVISQIMTFDTIDEVNDFINDMVKPDYNNWLGKEDYAMRFMELIEKRFS
ncbi:MAG TPA: hypothetical protein VN192_07455 [Flavobacterium sp.]|nr:hypothetical protein [Flavobacterium sp.]